MEIYIYCYDVYIYAYSTTTIVLPKPKIHGQSIYVKFFFHGSMIYLRHAHRQLVRNIIFVLVYM